MRPSQIIALGEDLEDLVEELVDMANSYRADEARYAAKGNDDMAGWCHGKAQAYQLAADKLYELL